MTLRAKSPQFKKGPISTKDTDGVCSPIACSLLFSVLCCSLLVIGLFTFFERLFERLSQEPDFEYALIDGTIVSVHQKASGARGGLKIRPSGDREEA